MSKVVCPMCEPFDHGSRQETIQWRTCDRHVQQLEKPPSQIEDIYRIDPDTRERVTWETCKCQGCEIERFMRARLADVDEKYKLTPDQQRYYTPMMIHAHCSRWQAERNFIIEHFTRGGWSGCLAPMVIAIKEETNAK